MTHPHLPVSKDIDACLIADRRALKKRLQGLKRRRDAGQPFDQGLGRLLEDIERSRATADQRTGNAASIEYPPELPISERRDEIAALIAKHQIVVLCGETGSGKSTQLPKICLDLGRGVFGRIGHTQPRRIAARSLAARISEELGREPGDTVGYKIRFNERLRPETSIKLLTDGMLLAEIQGDRWLNEYDTLIIDEAHERSLNIDFLLGYLKQLLPRRADLKLVITSATIDPQRFSRHFDDAPVIEVSGRTWPVEVRYRPFDEEANDLSLARQVSTALEELPRADRGDVLVFLSGEREIRETAEALRKHHPPGMEILPLYARLSAAEQSRVFRAHGQRRIVLATNVAETSLTVPGIRYVIDTGYARISRYSPRSKLQRLPIEPVSQASANQRKGRCGRVSAGVCVRLYSEEDFEQRPEFTEPEILRTNLAAVILQMQGLGFGEVEDFPFLDPPDSRLISDGYRTLQELGAMDERRRLTPLGRKLAKLPVDPRIGRMLLAAAEGNCLREVLIIAAALSIQDPRDRPHDAREAADEAHAKFQHPDSDLLSYVNLWQYLGEQRTHLSHNKFRKLCRERFLSYLRVQEWRDIHAQLRELMHGMGYRDNQVEASYAEVHQALLSGLLSNVGLLGEAREYQGARNSRFHIFPGSGLFKKTPKWLVAAERVETSRSYARQVAKVEPEWVERVGGHLLSRSYSEPHWEKRRAQVAAFEKTSLFGLVLNPKRRVNYGPIDPVESRRIFIRSALVEGDFQTRAAFFRNNRELIDQIEDLEHKSRRRDVLVDDEVLFAFYDERIPEGIYSGPVFEKWRQRAEADRPKLLHLSRDYLMQHSAAGVTEAQFPNVLEVGGMRLPLSYWFEPGHQADGVTLTVPLAALNQLPEQRCEWLVPGLLREKIIALLRGLPKQLRKAFVPVPDFADACLQAMQPADEPLTRSIARELKRMTGVYIPEDAWNEAQLDDHLRINCRVVDGDGQTLGAGRNLAELRGRLAGTADAGSAAMPTIGIEREGITDWDLGELPERVEFERGGIRYQGFPALVDRKDSVAIEVLDSADAAKRAMQVGLRRLFMLRLAKELRYLRRNIPNQDRLSLWYGRLSSNSGQQRSSLADELLVLVLDQVFFEQGVDIRDAASFQARLEAGRGKLMEAGNEAAALVSTILDAAAPVLKRLSGAIPPTWMQAAPDMRAQLDRLVHQAFLREIDYERLRQIPRYLRALERRLERLEQAPQRDRQSMQQLSALHDRWLSRWQAAREAGKEDPRLEEIRWMLEELRVSLFAQELKTAYPVSVKRVEKRWRELGL